MVTRASKKYRRARFARHPICTRRSLTERKRVLHIASYTVVNDPIGVARERSLEVQHRVRERQAREDNSNRRGRHLVGIVSNPLKGSFFAGCIPTNVFQWKNSKRMTPGCKSATPRQRKPISLSSRVYKLEGGHKFGVSYSCSLNRNRFS